MLTRYFCLVYLIEILNVKSLNQLETHQQNIYKNFQEGYSMNDKTQNTMSLAEKVAKMEEDYFFEHIDRKNMHSIIKQVEMEFESLQSSLTKEKDLKNVVSLFLILERLKKGLIFENYVLNIFEKEILSFTLLLDKTTNNSSGDKELGLSNDDVNFEIIQSSSYLRKQDSNNIFVQKIKNKRSNYPKKISRILKNWLKENMNNPYPSDSEKAILMELTELDSTQINNWFINARRRILPYMKSKYIKYD